jgi:hypothetical protein
MCPGPGLILWCDLSKRKVHKIWYTECKEPVYVGFTYYSSQGLARYNLDSVCVEEVRWEKGDTERLYIFCGEKKRKSSIWNRMFLYTTE